jgi:amino acid adenylation domain-containing protein
MSSNVLQGFRLSPQQTRLWALQQAGVANGAFCAVEIDGSLDVMALKAAVQGSINRHDSLRSHFPRLPGMKTAALVIAEDCAPQWQELDWIALSPEAQQRQGSELVQAARHFPGDLSQAPLLQVKLIRLAIDRHLLMLTMPALCLDAWSLKLLVADIHNHYGKSISAASKETVQYVQVSEWLHQLHEEDGSQAGRAYWNTVPLNPWVDPTLPFEGQSHSTYSVAVLTADINPATIQEFANQQQTSVRNVLLGCWLILMKRLTEEPNLVIGYGCDRRDYPELQTVLGQLGRWLPLHCPLSPDLRMNEVLPFLSDACRAAEEWQDSFAWEVDLPQCSFLPIGFEFASEPTHWSTEDVSFTLLDHHAYIEQFKLKLVAWSSATMLKVEIHYDTSRFAHEAIQSLVQQFQALLADVIAHPEKPISALNLLSDAEYKALFSPCVPLPENHCIHHLFETQVEKYPNAVALVYEDQQFTYTELNRRSNQLAHYLQQQGIGPEDVVGLYCGRSPHAIVALLAILKAGAAYLPVDPTWPVSAIATRLRMARVAWLITEQMVLADLSTLVPAVRSICLDRDAVAIAQETSSNPSSAIAPENLMYVLFTSGTSGQPKGVAVEHRQMYHYLCDISDPLALPTSARFATVSTLSADLGNTVLFSSLCTGGCLHLIAQERLFDPTALGNYFQQHPIDCLKIVPSHLQALLNTAHPAQLLPQRCLVLGGEVLSWDLVTQLQDLSPDCRILNHYGPTETTVGVLTYAVPARRTATAPGTTVPLGQPLAHIQVYVFDNQQQPVPKGLPGELYIGGPTVARGYLHQSDLTAERFIAHPFQPGEKLYKSGDRVCYLTDGTLLYLGRLDRQVKVRGYRVELAEIESVLHQHSGVRQAVVTAAPGSPVLVAYIVPHLGPSLDERGVKQFLRQQLPEYMVPSTFVCLNALPLTSNGKVDLQALPDPADRLQAQDLSYTPPSTATEQAIAQIWQQALGLKAVGLHDNFFDLGGHSLLMVQVHCQLREHFDAELTIGDLFHYPTISNLATYLDHHQTAPPEEPSLQRSLDRAQTRKAMTHRRYSPEVQDASP